jgi:hypothetical protein
MFTKREVLAAYFAVKLDLVPQPSRRLKSASRKPTSHKLPK